MQYQKVIEKLGYSPREAKVYLASLRLGAAHISDIAEKASIPRSSAQLIVDKLHADGLMNFYVMRRYKYWVAENPERLLANLKKTEMMVDEALPGFLEMRKEARKKTDNTQSENSLSIMRVCADSSHQPMLIANESVVIEYVNAAWEAQFGYTLKEVKGKETRILSSGKTPREVYKDMWRALHKKKLFQTDKVIDKRKDGSFFNMQTTIFTLEHDGYIYYVQVLEEIPSEVD